MITIVALGDSTTAGTPGFESPIEAPPDGRGDERSQYAYWLMQAQPNWRVLNRGVNGERSDHIAARFDRDVLSVCPDAVIIIAGVNDIYQGRTVASVTTQLGSMYDRARLAKIPVVAGSIVPYNTASADQNAAMREINRWIADEASKRPDVTFADTRRAVAALGDLDRLATSPDGLHPDWHGYRQMAEAISPILMHVLRQ